MVALFALGVMSVGWMALVGAFIAVEKLLPWKRLANRSVAAALAVIAVSIAPYAGGHEWDGDVTARSARRLCGHARGGNLNGLMHRGVANV
jgi:hypothetical protein